MRMGSTATCLGVEKRGAVRTGAVLVAAFVFVFVAFAESKAAFFAGVVAAAAAAGGRSAGAALALALAAAGAVLRCAGAFSSGSKVTPTTVFLSFAASGTRIAAASTTSPT